MRDQNAKSEWAVKWHAVSTAVVRIRHGNRLARWRFDGDRRAFGNARLKREEADGGDDRKQDQS